MSYTDRPGYDQPGYSAVEPAAVNSVAEYHDRVRWGPILAGLVIAISLQLVLSALGAAIGANVVAGSATPRTPGPAVTGVGIWTVISALIALFLGGYTAARACGPMSRSSALLNGGILWATTLVVGTWLLASGVSGAFGVLASNLGEAANQVLEPGGVNVPSNVPTPNVSAAEARDLASNIAATNWWFALGSLLSLVAALAGSTAGTRKPRSNSYPRTSP